MLQCVAVCCSVLQRVAVCCSVLQRVAVSCSELQCVAVCCSVSIPRPVISFMARPSACCSVLQYVAVCCNALWCGVVILMCHEASIFGYRDFVWQIYWSLLADMLVSFAITSGSFADM